MRRSVSRLMGVLGLMTLSLWANAESIQDYSVLIVSRERLEVGTPCELGIYIGDNKVGRLFQEQEVSFNLPPGRVVVRLMQEPGQAPGCAPGLPAANATAIDLHAGQVQKYRIANGPNGMYLKLAPPDQY
ncbi:hypothetical protein PMM47T1_11602 [Pseudomonas sp. M47T1]|uniref:hypothetical protein n=1 Tax=Pseudomonas sp. M47T1 TaxID=1179778 RepID=UPI0002608815|nr:hypothetical protein [Pseudomonas sp. M47T1]EIK96570.1 hypothetical protein PMM47T1_11602 [Pseudomonas sp. M47T1]